MVLHDFCRFHTGHTTTLFPTVSDPIVTFVPIGVNLKARGTHHARQFTFRDENCHLGPHNGAKFPNAQSEFSDGLEMNFG